MEVYDVKKNFFLLMSAEEFCFAMDPITISDPVITLRHTSLV